MTAIDCLDAKSKTGGYLVSKMDGFFVPKLKKLSNKIPIRLNWTPDEVAEEIETKGRSMGNQLLTANPRNQNVLTPKQLCIPND